MNFQALRTLLLLLLVNLIPTAGVGLKKQLPDSLIPIKRTPLPLSHTHFLSSSSNPSGPTRCRATLVAAQLRAMLPVF